MAPHCPNCGNDKLPRISQFCPECGFSLNNIDSSTTSRHSAAQSPTEDELGFTQAMPPLNTRPETDNPAAPPDDDDLGMTLSMPAARISQLPANAPAEPPGDEPGMTMAMPDAKITRQDLFVESFNDDGLTMAMPNSPNTQQKAHFAITEEQDGLTTAMPAAGSTAANIPSRSASSSSQPGASAIELELKLGETLQERYRLDKLLGRGGYGAVYLAEDIKLKRVCVVKQMLTRKGSTPVQLEQQRVSFEREASLLVQLNHPGHPNIPEIYDYFTDETGNYLVMKYIAGHSLKDEIEQNNGKIPWRQAARYAADISSALHYMHTHGQEPIMHRDIKPANILLGTDGRLWLVDFGLAKVDPLTGSSKAMETKAAGSLGYAPLEQWFGEAVPASDIYAVGVTLHQMVTGVNPLQSYSGRFDIQKIHQLHGKLGAIREIDRKLPQRLEEIITSATAPEVADRPSALQLQQQLEVLVSGAQNAALFTFKNGQSARTIEELVDLCEKNRKEAQTHLYNSDFERWFALINRNDLASAAVQAVEQGKNERDGLEKFLKLILPNLARRRLIKFGWLAARLALALAAMVAGAAFIIAFVGSLIVGQLVEQTIGDGVVWTFSTADLNKEQVYEESYLVEKFNELAGSYFDDPIQVDLAPPDLAHIQTQWNSLPINITLSARLAQNSKQPRFYITRVGGVPLGIITNNISAGINRGIQDAFRRGPVDVTSMILYDDRLTFFIEEARPAPDRFVPTLAPPTPTSPPPTPTPTPTVTPTPVNVTLVVIFNDLAEDVDMTIEGQTVTGQNWGTTLTIVSGRAEVLEPPAGRYDYVVKYKDGVEAAAGTEIWTLKQAYRVRITPDLIATPTPGPEATPQAESNLGN